MIDSDSDEIEKVESQKENPSFAERISQLGNSLDPTGPIGTYGFCIVCGNPRIRYEPTGLVCSNPECILRLKENYDESEKETKAWFRTLLEEIAAKIGVDIPEDVVEACSKINEELNRITFQLEELVLATLTSTDLSNSTDNLSKVSEKLQIEVEKIAEALKKKEEKTDLS